eukprot:CAMPEP_0194557724 /NCGR_PEP_ID=MMETSP0253-20130528/99390_1 /TAXON_ID=2966 /ORGANISM="Noctiluca scintillans" /LENGTH=470 /DNA_ID=CAMNT_0039405233 /DNA_START=10 /DNA_END=1422 /DNA_ORIENTATION=+
MRTVVLATVCLVARGLFGSVDLDVDKTSFLWPVFQEIGLAPGATLTLNLSAKLTTCTTLLLLSSDELGPWTKDSQDVLVAWTQNPDTVINTYSNSRWRASLCANETMMDVSIDAPVSDTYALVVLNVDRETFSLQGWFSYVNPNGEHLPLQFVNWPILCWLESWGMVCLAVITLGISLWRRSAFHALLFLCMSCRASDLFLQWNKYETLSHEGQLSPTTSGEVLLGDNIYQLAEMVMLFLFSIGWGVLRTRLRENERHFIVMACIFDIVFSMIAARDQAKSQGMEAMGASDLYLMELMSIKASLGVLWCMFTVATYFATILNRGTLTANVEQSLFLHESARETADLYAKRNAFVNFQTLFFAIILMPIITQLSEVAVWFLGGQEWMASALCRIAWWCIYALLALLLVPGCAGADVSQLARAVEGDPAADAEEEPVLHGTATPGQEFENLNSVYVELRDDSRWPPDEGPNE